MKVLYPSKCTAAIRSVCEHTLCKCTVYEFLFETFLLILRIDKINSSMKPSRTVHKHTHIIYVVACTLWLHCVNDRTTERQTNGCSYIYQLTLLLWMETRQIRHKFILILVLCSLNVFMIRTANGLVVSCGFFIFCHFIVCSYQ